MDPSYTLKVSAQQQRTYEVDLKTNRYWQGALVGNQKRGEKSSDLVEYWSFYKTLNPELVQKAAQKYLNTENQIQLTLLQKLLLILASEIIK